jgi:hypothetical protein
MRSKSQAAWETATKCAKLTEEADDPQEREYYARLRDGCGCRIVPTELGHMPRILQTLSELVRLSSQ